MNALDPTIWLQIYYLSYLQRAKLASQYAIDMSTNVEVMHTYLRKIKVGHPGINPNVHQYIFQRFPVGCNIVRELEAWPNIPMETLSI